MFNITKLKKLIDSNCNFSQIQLTPNLHLYYSHMAGRMFLTLRGKESVNIIQFMQKMRFPRIENNLEVIDMYNNEKIKSTFEQITEDYRKNGIATNTNISFIDDTFPSNKKVAVFNLNGLIRCFETEYINYFKQDKVYYYTNKAQELLIVTNQHFDPIAVMVPYGRLKGEELKNKIIEKLSWSTCKGVFLFYLLNNSNHTINNNQLYFNPITSNITSYSPY